MNFTPESDVITHSEWLELCEYRMLPSEVRMSVIPNIKFRRASYALTAKTEYLSESAVGLVDKDYKAYLVGKLRTMVNQ